MEVEEEDMKKDWQRSITRREVISKALAGIAGAVFASILPRFRRGRERDEFMKNISNRDASYYKRLAG